MKRSPKSVAGSQKPALELAVAHIMALLTGATEIGGTCSGDMPTRTALVSAGLARWIGDGQTCQITDAGMDVLIGTTKFALSVGEDYRRAVALLEPVRRKFQKQSVKSA